MFPFAVLLALAAGEVRLAVDFEDKDLSAWSLPSPDHWTIASEGASEGASESGNRFLRLWKPGLIGEPRRPLTYALRQDLCVSDFDLRVKVRRAGKSMLITFGYQDTLHFYYAHLSADSGEHQVHNGLFKVDGGERFRIAGQGSPPALPDLKWQQIRVVRNAASGLMELWVGQDSKPRFRHIDGAFRFGRIGLGSFNETGDFDDLVLTGRPSSECR